MTTIPATAARRDFVDLVKGAAEGHKMFRIQQLTFKDRIVYSIDENARQVTVHRARTHYGE